MDDSSTAQTSTANADELTTELSEAEELAYVDRILGKQPTVKTNFGDGGAGQAKEADANDENAAKETEETKEEEQVAEVKEESEAKSTDEVMEQEEKPVQIEAPDFSDLWIEVEGMVVDDEGNATPQPFKITVDGGIPDEMRFKNDKQLAEVLDALNEMRGLKADRQAEYDEAIEAQQEQEATAASQKEQMDAWDAEIAQLIEAGLIEAPKAKATDPNFREDPSVKLVDDVFKYMIEHNDKLVKAGKPAIRSFGTIFALYNKEKGAAEAEAKAKAEADLVKKRGGMVGGGSSVSGGGSDKPKVYKAGSAKSIWAVDTSDL